MKGIFSPRSQQANGALGVNRRLHIPHAAGADAETLLEQHRPPLRTHISWEFDNRNWLRCAAAPAAASREIIPDGSSNPSDDSHRETRVGQDSTPAWGTKDTEQRTRQAGSHRTPEDAGTAIIAKRDRGDASPSPRGGGSAPRATGNEAAGRSADSDWRDGGVGGDDGDGMPYASGGGGAAIDAAIVWESEAKPPDKASMIAATAKTAKSSAVAQAPSTPRSLQRTCSEGDDERNGKDRITDESGMFRSVRPAASVDTSGGDIAATGLKGLLEEEDDYDPETGGLASSTDVGDVVGRIDTPPRSSRGRRPEDEGQDGDSLASAFSSSELRWNGPPARSARDRRENSDRSSSVGEAQRTPGQAVHGAPQVPPGRDGAQDDSEVGGNRASRRKFVGNPAAADSGQEYAAYVGSNSSSCSSTGRNSPQKGRTGSPKTEGERTSIFETPASSSGGRDGQEQATPTSRKGADSREPHRVNETAEKEAKFAQPKVSNQGDRTRRRGRDTGHGGGGGGGGDDIGGSDAFLSDTDVVKPTNKAASQHEPGVTQRANTRDVERSSSKGYGETAEGGGGGGRGGGEEQMIGDSSTVGEREYASAGEEDDYGSDFASQVPHRFPGKTIHDNAPTVQPVSRYLSQL